MSLVKEVDINTQERIRQNLLEETAQLERKRQNLEQQVMDMRIRLESERKHFEQEKNQKFTKEMNDLKKQQNKVNNYASTLELKEKALEEREKAVEMSEVKFGDISLLKTKILQDKSDFLSYKDKIDKELELKKIELTELNAKWETLEVEEDRLLGVATSLEKSKKDLDVEWGMLNEAKKEFELHKKNVLDPISLNKKEDNKNVKDG